MPSSDWKAREIFVVDADEKAAIAILDTQQEKSHNDISIVKMHVLKKKM